MGKDVGVEPREDGFVCPGCGGSNIGCYYTNPIEYKCHDCGRELIDDNAGPAIPVLTREEAMRKRPGLFGQPYCLGCSHGPHEGECRVECEFCKPPPPHIYKFRLA